MKKITRQSVPDSRPIPKRVLRLSLETVRMLSADELARAAGGCVTPSYTTDHPPSGVC